MFMIKACMIITAIAFGAMWVRVVLDITRVGSPLPPVPTKPKDFGMASAASIAGDIALMSSRHSEEISTSATNGHESAATDNMGIENNTPHDRK